MLFYVSHTPSQNILQFIPIFDPARESNPRDTRYSSSGVYQHCVILPTTNSIIKTIPSY